MNRIKILREEKNIYQKDLAKLLKVSIPAITYYENEKRTIDTKTASILADYFDCSIDYLLGKSDIRNPEELKNIPFANAGGLNTDGLEHEDLLELQKQIDYIKKLKAKK
jgi:transcriptional regulator with XRE-family HTH domain